VSDYFQRVINDPQTLIDDAQATLTRFEETGMDEEFPEDYDNLMTILDDAIEQQREHTQALLS